MLHGGGSAAIMTFWIKRNMEKTTQDIIIAIDRKKSRGGAMSMWGGHLIQIS